MPASVDSFVPTPDPTQDSSLVSFGQSLQLTDAMTAHGTVLSDSIVFDGKDRGECTRATYEYPLFTGGDAAQSLNVLVREWFVFSWCRPPHASLRRAMQRYFQEASKERANSHDNHDKFRGWDWCARCKVIAWGCGRISLVYDEDMDTGGAHSQQEYRAATVDLATGRRLSFGSLFTPASWDSVRQIGEAAFRRTFQIPPTEGWAEMYPDGAYDFPYPRSPDEDIAASDTTSSFVFPHEWCVSRTGLIFFFQPYEVASYAMSRTRFEVPARELRPFVRDPRILAFWGNDGNVTSADAKTCIRLLGQEVFPAVREMAKEFDLKSPFETNQPVSVKYMAQNQAPVKAAAE